MAGPDADKWQHTASVEMQAHLENGTWQLVQLPAGCKAIGSKWVFKVKHNSDSSVECYKACLVTQGFSQHPGVDFTETFAPTTKWAALHAVKHLFHYLCGSVDLCLTYGPDPSSPDLFCTYSDADHGGNPDNGCSTSAYVLKMGTGMISWSSKLQSIVALSTTEAEFVAAISASQETIWMHQFLSELGYSFSHPSLVHMEISWAFRLARTQSITAA
jgi:hypothetical protein